jgi:Tol biopolymer transport system component
MGFGRTSRALLGRAATLVILVMAVTIGTSAVMAGEQPAAGVTLRAGIEKESVEGDLRGAIALYERAAREAGSDRALAAKALLASADAYRKLGDPRARTTYETVVSRYADQQVYAAAARTRLGKGGASQPQPTLTTRRVMDGSNVERVSPDGRYLLRSGKNLSLYEIATGKLREVATDGSTDEADPRYPLHGVFSVDGKQVAYELFIEKSLKSVLRVVPIGDQLQESRTLVDNADLANIEPMDWSPDGRWIAVSIRRMDRTAQIGLVDARDGALRVLRSVEWLGPSQMAFSPDGRTVAYDRPSGEGEVERDVFVMAIDGSREVPAVVNPSDDRLVAWAPGGRQLLFTSDRGSTVGLWTMPIADGKAGPTADFIADTGPSRPLGLTASGTLYYRALVAGADIWAAPFDRQSQQLTSPPVRLLRQFKGLNNMPEWSADGQYLAYVSRRGVLAPSPVVIAISDARTGTPVREVPVKASYMLYPKWSPDGRTFIARGSDLKGRDGILRIDAMTGETHTVVSSETCSGVPYWAAQGRTFYCTNFKTAVVEVDVDSGDVTRRFQGSPGNGTASPDGQWIVVWTNKSLVRISTAGGVPRQILTFTPETQMGNLMTLTFTPDSKHVVFGGKVAGVTGMWVIGVEGGEPRQIKVDASSVSMWRFNPKTWQVAYTPSNAPTTEVRVLEHFLPAAAGRTEQAARRR